MKLKFNWGFGIAATYIVFVIVALTGVVIFMNQDVSLETENYYAKGIKYQEQIDKVNRTQNLPEQLEISLAQTGITFSFPKMFDVKDYSGIISFYRPNDEKKDFNIDLLPDTSHSQTISIETLDKGLWKVKVDWSAKENNYYNEKLIMVN
ncbi:MAG: cbb3-type cytochrome c oxidase maturation protein CcoH [Ignavibacteria bacterium]|nr:MAG: cbb3-type cytochrome c oxidase maturation protein CcoH [Ignavibacteria bacterium]KAF0161894.1 MAG: cbb3-type cytochrome c oxidase maturation protein CcoH [Ignavibacteria bacterium]